MARGVQGGGCVIVHVVAMGGSSPKKKPPRMTSGGNGKPFLWGYAGSRWLGRPFKASQPVTLGLSGFGGESIRYQPTVGWKKTRTPCDVRSSIAVFEVWEIGPGANQPAHRPEHLFIQPEVVGVAFGSLLNQSTLQTMWARHPAYPRPVCPPRGATVSRGPARLVRPLSQPYHLRSRNTRDKDLKKHGDLDHQTHFLRVVGLGFKITSIVVMMIEVRPKPSVMRGCLGRHSSI